jgi:tRNA-dihydrouridine synthase B
MVKGFWKDLKRPIIGLAPMDGVTDAACRYVTDKYGSPDILFTEFTSVEGIVHGADKLLDAFIYHKTETPTVAQIFGADPDAFYKVAVLLSEMGFDGIDINMGCPDHNVAKKGGGAGLIRTPQLAQVIIKKTMQGTQDWADGKNVEDLDLPENIVNYVKIFQPNSKNNIYRKPLPVSVKTRIGFDDIVTEEWISTLLDVEPVNITLHGRTLAQLYSGDANWDEIGKAATLAKKTETTLLGNGDIKSLDEAYFRIKEYATNGALIGRAAWGNPWIFKDKTPELPEKFQVAVEHCQALVDMLPRGHFLTLRKHLSWYCKGFDNATAVRMQLMRVNTVEEIKGIVENFVSK